MFFVKYLIILMMGNFVGIGVEKLFIILDKFVLECVDDCIGIGYGVVFWLEDCFYFGCFDVWF